MKSKNILSQSAAVLNHFNSKSQQCFEHIEVFQILNSKDENSVLKLLSNMVKRGLLMRLKQGLYYIIPYEQEASSFMPDWHLLAEHLTKGTDHYIGYYSAMQIHNLITQPSLKEQIVVAKQLKPSILKIRNVSFQFIYHNADHFFGAKKTWINSFNKVMCSDLEKTIIDCLFKPDYAGGIVEIARAIHTSIDKIKYDQLFEYVQRFRSQAVIKRLGFLLETLEINSGIIKQLQKIKTASYVLLDTELPKSGKMISRWSIQQNLETETIKSAIYT
ncbi:MAG: transcriptional regulator [Lewinellaceae bacterium]|nr:transcriptional regulator [Lewinellaceae bacterium]